MKPRYWHFALDSRRTRYDYKPILIGETMKVEPPVVLCERGLHASKRIIDALKYAPGAYLCLVELSGVVEHGDDKSVATERKVIAAADATEMLYRFSVDCAARAMERVCWTHEDSWYALSIRQAHMAGLADDADLSAAGSAAWSAAESAAWSAAESAADSAAWSAAWSAAESAADSAAESAAWSAADSAAEPAERDIQNAELTRRAYKLLKIK